MLSNNSLQPTPRAERFAIDVSRSGILISKPRSERGG